MDQRRAKAITASPVMTHVTYNGIPIYIENVDEETGIADIHPLDQPSNKLEVPVTSLVEH
ncbi:MAG TPA: H-type small acid-soluble spore protein [Bacillota bacterium]|jgi:small acid-soluble spore protein H (minor)|nr:H-type small acid-soluble spore protein [Bacillota bacterium]HNT02950.1 H-type small acid-soluble spore protein [Bacillota bacterium]HOH89312.1 H-type small acid-soluble spore protein [Bacillota bacterium]HPA54183.1 H-type small acid-soluble spore protein [Bacillota bacterium]HPX67756.1 H-type small acid-soluble spore protein [Bacillota bacterium]